MSLLCPAQHAVDPFTIPTPYCVPDSVLSIDAMANGPCFGILVPRLMSFPATNLLDPARYQSQKRKEATSPSEAAIDKARTPNPSTIPNLSRHTEYWGSTTHH
ncbi:hypothetical protein CABS01_05645 [Colletotrichum abscissum]|uniref:Uncharacterized protein n=5 Tax=Colletotrichum acutatum species complex TaxID=2707335 RepID=A0A9P9XJW6_9PEZI|nr:uncharacterized protein CCOS01_03879 [Colletotrichum costaricense]XP_060405275.1 uncharacterized protein CABS01_05645 [Colletotrichum abscissum]KAI3540222.1 hypothetical protein CSPX01_08411 [Colletotrichum filicis]KAK1451278.1 hypothetical protein CCUS01_11065 [Colletotrichum cuscutae]KAK1460276.1 hypothetical protein CMEL01_03275 [Colletotrichum melonis]KAI3555179.1 hypothetical protein CABS02_04627 [Colletotrichum abscissum]KAK1521140.1 hypothetical protein CABS01_05645 [Colletotrichum 